MKKVLLMVVDALASRVIIPAMDSGRLPNFSTLKRQGAFREECLSIFPSITPAATCSIATGVYPQEHGIIGNFWFDKSHNELAYYGDDFWVILQRGLSDFFEDFLYKLNHCRIDAATIFELAENAGLSAASLNYMIYRGNHVHETEIPFWLRILPGVASGIQLRGPGIMMLGDFVATEIPRKKIDIDSDGGLLNRFGFQDEFTARELLELVHARHLPDVTLAYFPDNDYQSHEHGPDGALHVLDHIDQMLGEMFAFYGSAERFLADHILIITGDHSQSDVLDDDSGLIALDEILQEFSQTVPGESWSDEEESIMICPNLRTALIYFNKPNDDQVRKVIERLLSDSRIDQVIRRTDQHDHRNYEFRVHTSDRSEISFRAGSDGPNNALDDYGQLWSWDGDLRAVGAEQRGGTLVFDEYPNAFERIAGGLCCENSSQLWVTARPGYEFGFAGAGFHCDGGSHGSLHRLDSVAPLFISGVPSGFPLPQKPRIVDIAPVICELLGIPFHHRMGESHLRKQKSS